MWQVQSCWCELRKCWISLIICWIPKPQQQPVRVSGAPCCSGSSRAIMLVFLVSIYYHNHSITARALCCVSPLWGKGKTSRLEAEERLLPEVSCSRTCLLSFRLWKCLPVLFICKRQCRYIAGFQGPILKPVYQPLLFSKWIINCGDIQRPFSWHSFPWRQELGNEFQQDNPIIPAPCCNLIVLHSVILGALCKKSLLH